ncbi:DUF465 domain-containing protein [Pseudomonas sp. RTC3]|uniref:YdcH family protein n=1 Tax=unclassified Pseudomonas TaxID=196821 RepID=UPI002AB4B570|nr:MULTISPECIES: DUF465 domain-containing protein [unclassified Pseudomonas]MEB0063267.1 DUF465 domain-containing protein [Pseudomonas sp. RTC3]MDY7564202.1 DUF465 domain-containing protein [Pseudomonas sp. 5C2]MEB0005487.1 DUF465 domain-containing protein [Pseudomonas sp. RTB2]MEB0019941.1 DUF465 domain-containing protein [Pseudomonas sp. RTB3]MEB0027181.1 DUF465 domain-containing protein [Pseudomonas sp. MH9.2]
MPVKHNLLKDLNITKEEITRRRDADDRLSQLLESYNSIDAEVVDAESGSAGNVTDEQLRKLKEKRLHVKDKIVKRLTSSD